MINISSKAPGRRGGAPVLANVLFKRLFVLRSLTGLSQWPVLLRLAAPSGTVLRNCNPCMLAGARHVQLLFTWRTAPCLMVRRVRAHCGSVTSVVNTVGDFDDSVLDNVPARPVMVELDGAPTAEGLEKALKI